MFSALGVRVVVGAALTVPVIGLIPADSVRWTSKAGVAIDEVHVLEEDIKRAEFPKEVYGLQVTGDCMRSLRIQHGDIVIVEPPHGRIPRNGDLVVVRVGDEVSLKRWSMFGDTVELRDGDGNIVWRGPSEGLEVVAFYVGWKPAQPV
ncbi:LexA family protein [Nitrolancea hollandica]|uniref:LexA family protein n=1 Tax=Nitrolancea hollandica TaxID=1206749 RepID=UPI001EE63C96|nr:S24 family peptidase [Nitrolancea hollandica]